MKDKTPKDVVLARYPLAAAYALAGPHTHDPYVAGPDDKKPRGVIYSHKRGPRYWRVRVSPEGRWLGSAGTTATAWSTAAKDLWRADIRHKRMTVKTAALKAFVDVIAPPDLAAFKRVAVALGDYEAKRADAAEGVYLSLSDLLEVL